MGEISALVSQIEQLYLPGGDSSSDNSPETFEKLVTMHALRNSVEALEAFDETIERPTRAERLLDLYAVSGIFYVLVEALQTLAKAALGEPFPMEPGSDLHEIKFTRRFLAHPVNLIPNSSDRRVGRQPAGALVMQGVWDPISKREGFIIAVADKSYEWGKNKYRPFFLFKYVTTLKMNLLRVYLPKILSGLQNQK